MRQLDSSTRHRVLLACVATLMILGLFGVRPSMAAALEPVTSVEGITEYRLENGLRVLLFPEPSKPTVTVAITYLVGSAHENYGETGMAHLLEHLLFKGSTHHPNVTQELTDHGARANGTTWLDRTNYFETVNATPENLEWALDLEADRMVNSFISGEDLESEMTVVRNELEMGENYPMQILEERVMSTAYLWHNYGHSTIGARSDLENVPIERLQAFYKKWYQPDNAMLVVAGAIDERRVLEQVQDTFGAIPRPERTLSPLYTAEPAQDGERRVTLRRVGGSQAVMAAYHTPAGSHEEAADVDVLAFILSDTPSGRLHKALVETGLAASVDGQPYRFKDPSMMLFSAEVSLDKDVVKARDVLLATLDEMASSPPSQAEITRAKEAYARRWQQLASSPQWMAVSLSDWAAMGDWRLMFLFRDRVAAVTPESVARVAQKYLVSENRTVGTYIATKDARRVEVPAPPDVASLLADYKGGEGMSQGEALDPAPEAIEATLERITLTNGMKLVMLAKKTRGETVFASFLLHFGDVTSLRGKGMVGGLTAAMLMRGTASLSRQEIKDRLNALKSRVHISGDATGLSVSLTARQETLEPTLRLIADVLQHPSFPNEELKQLKEEKRVGLEESKTDPGAVAGLRMDQGTNPYPADDPRAPQTPEEALKSLEVSSLAQIKAFHGEFYGASAAELALVGQFETETISTLVEALFGRWQNQISPQRLRQKYRAHKGHIEAIQIPDKEGATLVAGLSLKLNQTDRDFPALTLGNFMTGGGFLSSRLATRLRQQDGLSYGAGSWFRADPFDKSGFFGSYAIYAPQNDTRVLTAYQEEIQKIVQDGFSDEELDRAREGMMEYRKGARSNENQLSYMLAQNEHNGRTMAFEAALEKRIEALSARSLNKAMRKHIKPDKLVIIRAGDFARDIPK